MCHCEGEWEIKHLQVSHRKSSYTYFTDISENFVLNKKVASVSETNKNYLMIIVTVFHPYVVGLCKIQMFT